VIVDRGLYVGDGLGRRCMRHQRLGERRDLSSIRPVALATVVPFG
jgi:hypothetical protein